jgi:hypothetical protein
MLSFMRVALSGSYRMVSGVELAGMTNSEVAGFSAGATLKFGRF